MVANICSETYSLLIDLGERPRSSVNGALGH